MLSCTVMNSHSQVSDPGSGSSCVFGCHIKIVVAMVTEIVKSPGKSNR